MRQAIATIRGKKVPCLWLAWSTQWEELRDGVGQYPVALVEIETGEVVVLNPADIRFPRTPSEFEQMLGSCDAEEKWAARLVSAREQG